MKEEYDTFTPDGEPGFTLSDGHPSIRVSYQQLRRYAYEGVPRNGEYIKLRVFGNPNIISTTLSEWHRFINRCNAKNPQSICAGRTSGG